MRRKARKKTPTVKSISVQGKPTEAAPAKPQLTNAQKIARIKPYEARSFINNWCKQHVPEPSVIFDCGALSGNQSAEFSRAYPDAKVFCFEANPGNAVACRENTAKYKNITVVEGALCDKDGEVITFWHSIGNNRSGSSSMYKFTEFMKKRKHYKQRPVTVKTIALDAWAERNGIDHVDIMWIDIQGAEGPMLAGASKLLKTVKIAHIEVHLTPAYNDQTMFDEIAFHTWNAGLKMRHWIKHPSVVQCGDAIFQRSEE